MRTHHDYLIQTAVVGAPLEKATATRIAAAIREEMGAGSEFTLKYVPEIERTVSGKHRFVISHCKDMT